MDDKNIKKNRCTLSEANKKKKRKQYKAWATKAPKEKSLTKIRCLSSIFLSLSSSSLFLPFDRSSFAMRLITSKAEKKVYRRVTFPFSFIYLSLIPAFCSPYLTLTTPTTICTGFISSSAQWHLYCISTKKKVSPITGCVITTGKMINLVCSPTRFNLACIMLIWSNRL